MSHVFISYSKQNVDFARYLRALLEGEGCAVWMDEVRLQPSARWWKAIEENIHTCAAFVVVMSPEAAESDWVEREILLAEKLKRPLFPVLLAGDAWSRLANIQYEDCRAGLRAKLSRRFLNGIRAKVGVGTDERGLTLALVEGDLLEQAGDVIAVKYSGNHNGAAAAVAHRLMNGAGVAMEQISPKRGKFALLPSQGTLGAPQVLYVGTSRLRDFGYEAVRELGMNTMRALAQSAPQTRHLLMTVNGPGKSLDENESLLYQVRGYLDAYGAGEFPAALERITLVEREQGRLQRLRAFVDEQALDLPEFAGRWNATQEHGVYRLLLAQTAATPPPIVDADAKPHAFVILPPALDLEDAFYYGIQTPIHARGLLCERVEDALTDELFEQAKARIISASVVVADVSERDPMVFLQVGLAWGSGRPLILVQGKGSETMLGMSAHRYGNIKALESVIRKELDALGEKGKI
jgi:hypothetical protein